MDYLVFIDNAITMINIISDVVILYHENREMIYHQFNYILNLFNRIELDDKTCIICLTDLQTNDTVSICTGSCRQVLGHKECLDVWFRNHKNCPMCRSINHGLI